MKDKIDPKILMIVGLIIVLLYCGFRSLTSVAAMSSQLSQLSGEQALGTPERLLRDLDRTIVVEADTSLGCPDHRDPFSVLEAARITTSGVSTRTTTTGQTTRRSKMRLTGLILDQNPMAIVEVGGQSLEVRVGSLLEGYKVVGIDERGVHILKGDNIIIIR
jgi:hypothetical protein